MFGPRIDNKYKVLLGKARPEEKGGYRSPDSSLKGRERATVSQTNIGTVSKATLGKLLRDGVERTWVFPGA